MNNNLTEKILNKLRSGEFKMKPRIYFILKAILIILGTLIVALFTLFLISFISFALRTNFRGFGVLFSSIPWLLIIVAAFLIIVLEILFKHFAFTYRRPILYSVIGILIVVILGTLIIDRTPFHRGLFDRAREGRLPIFGPIYRNFGPRDTAPFNERFLPPMHQNFIR